jgi:hypothetical protein
MVQLLLEAGGDPTIRDIIHHETPLDAARRFDESDCDWIEEEEEDEETLEHHRQKVKETMEQNRQCIALLEAATAEPERPRALFKARALLDAARPIEKARKDAREKEGRRTRAAVNSEAAAAAAPAYLEERVEKGQELPRVAVAVAVAARAGANEKEELVATVKYALGLEGGSEGSVGLPPELFVELLGFLVPPWDCARRGLPLGGEDYVVEDEEEEGAADEEEEEAAAAEEEAVEEEAVEEEGG